MEGSVQGPGGTKTLVLFVAATPYGQRNADTARRIAGAF